MRVLVTSSGQELPGAIATHLSEEHHVRLTGRSDIATDLEFVRSDLGHDGSTNELVRGMDAIVHGGETSPQASASEQLDCQTRCTYNLLKAAVEERVSRFVYLSSLDVMERYAPDLVVTERWRPMPSTDISTLSHHLGEHVCREFGRERLISVVSLRLGRIVNEDDAPGLTALHIDDAIHAVECALTAELDSSQTTWSRPSPPTRWGVFHIQSPVANSRFTTTTAERVLGYSPTFDGQVR